VDCEGAQVSSFLKIGEPPGGGGGQYVHSQLNDPVWSFAQMKLHAPGPQSPSQQIGLANWQCEPCFVQ
jgi:hypothetical protein